MRTMMKLAIAFTAIVLAVLVIILAVTAYRARTAKTMDELVTSSMTFDNPKCTWPSSVEVSFRNNGSEDINWLKWSFNANEKGHSTELVKWYSLKTYETDLPIQWATDLVIKPGKAITVCAKYPLPDSDLTPHELDIRLRVIAFDTPTARYDETNPSGQ